jgi:hypothetical protein
VPVTVLVQLALGKLRQVPEVLELARWATTVGYHDEV